MAKKKPHAHRTFGEDGTAVCECGKEFDDDAAWMRHYESSHTAAERREIENRPDPADEKAAAKAADEAHAAVVRARDEAEAAPS